MGGRLEGKVAVITGTGDGIGRAGAIRFAEEGARVVGCDVRPEPAAETVRLVREAGGEMDCLCPLDLSDEAEAHRLMAHALEVFGGIDILYNNASALRLGSAVDMRLEDWNFTLTHALTTQWLATKHAIPHLKRRGGGSIIFTSSTAGDNVGTGFAANLPLLASYSVAKAGVNRLATLCAIDLARYNIRVNTIAPAWIDVPSTKAVYGEPGSDTYEAVTRTMLVDRLGRAEEVGETAVFLASDEVSFIVGANIRVDGGHFPGGGVGAPDLSVAALFASATNSAISVDSSWSAPAD